MPDVGDLTGTSSLSSDGFVYRSIAFLYISSLSSGPRGLVQQRLPDLKTATVFYFYFNLLDVVFVFLVNNMSDRDMKAIDLVM